jgi:hypothetical membrane protein
MALPPLAQYIANVDRRPTTGNNSLHSSLNLTTNKGTYKMTHHQTISYSERPSRTGQIDRWLALGGIAGPVLFVLTFTIEGLLQPDYSPVKQAVSDLGVGNNAWILNGSVIILGALMVGFAISFYRVVRPEASAALRLVCALLIAGVGIGYAAAGIFPETTPLHWLVGAPLIFLGAPVAFFLAGLLIRGDRAWRGWAVYSFIASFVTALLVAIMFYTFSPSAPPDVQVAGLMERVLFIEILAWYVAFGWELFRRLSRATRDANVREAHRQEGAGGVGR